MPTPNYGTAPNSTTYTPYTGNPMAAGSFPNRNTALSPTQFSAYTQSLGYTPASSSLLPGIASSPSMGAAGVAQKSGAQAQMPSWWNPSPASSGQFNPASLLPGKGAYQTIDTNPRTNLTLALQMAGKPDPVTLFQNWLKGPQGPMYNAAMSATPQQATTIKNSPFWDQLRWDINAAYGSGGATTPGGPLAAGGIYGPPMTIDTLKTQGKQLSDIVAAHPGAQFQDPKQLAILNMYNSLDKNPNSFQMGPIAPGGVVSGNSSGAAATTPEQKSAGYAAAGITPPPKPTNLPSVQQLFPGKSFDFYAKLNQSVAPGGGHVNSKGQWVGPPPPPGWEP